MMKKIFGISMVLLMLITVFSAINVSAALQETEIKSLTVDCIDANNIDPKPAIKYREIYQNRTGIFIETYVRFEIINVQGSGTVVWDFGDNSQMYRGGGLVEYYTYRTLSFNFKKNVRVALLGYDFSGSSYLYCTVST